MSHTRDDVQDNPQGNDKARNELSVLLDNGASWSAHERNCVFLNTGADARADGRFASVSAVSGLDFPDDARAVIAVDWDHDGDQDLWLSNRNAPRIRFMRNDVGSNHNFLSLFLVGNGETTNRDAIGARVEVVLATEDSVGNAVRELPEDRDLIETSDPNGTATAPNRLIKTLHAGEGFLSQSSRWIHFGLGAAPEIAKVTVRWPGGELEEFANLKINGRYKLFQGGNIKQDPMQTDPAPVLASSVPELPSPADRFRIPLVALLPMPDLPFIGPFGELQPLLSVSDDGPLLINCWSTSCVPCLKELKEFTDRADEIRDAGINILALSLDQAGDAENMPGAAENLLQQMGFPFAKGRTTLELGMALNTIHNVMTTTGGQLPVPTSFLIDSSGLLTAIYKGPISVDTLLADARYSSRSRWERFHRAANLPGRIIENEILGKAMIKSDRFARMRLAKHLQELGWHHAASIQNEELAKTYPESAEKRAILGEVYLDQGILLAKQKKWAEATDAFRSSLDNHPDSKKLHYNLGIVYQKLGQKTKSRQHYQEAISKDPDFISAHLNLARLLAKEKEWNQAAIHFEKVVRARPKDEKSHYNLGVMLVKQNKWEQAAKRFQTALHLRPEFPQARIYLERVQKNLE